MPALVVEFDEFDEFNGLDEFDEFDEFDGLDEFVGRWDGGGRGRCRGLVRVRRGSGAGFGVLGGWRGGAA